MPLDVQPLSPGRRALMLLVMLVLLGCSLGFAEFLVRQRTARQDEPRLMVPPGAREAPALNGAPWETDEPLNQLKINLVGNPRTLTAFYFASKGSDNPATWTQDLLAAYRRMTGEEPGDAPITVAATILGGRAARELQCQWVSPNQAEFLLIRGTRIGGQALVICFSGPGLLTDADTLYFNAYCLRDVALAPQRSSPGKGEP